MTKLARFRPLPNNPNGHTQRGMRELENSIRQDGYTEPMVAAADLTVLSGNARLETVADILDVEPVIVETDGTRPVIHIRTDIASADDATAKRIAVRANRVAELDLHWQMATLLESGDEVIAALWAQDELAALARSEAASQEAEQKAAYDFLEDEQARPAVPVSEQLRFPLAIVLTKAEHDRWQEHKRSCRAKDDRTALLALLGGV